MSQYVLSVAAESDLNQIWEYIAEDNLEVRIDGSIGSLKLLNRLPKVQAWDTSA